MMSVTRSRFGVASPGAVERGPQRVQVGLADVRQDEVLAVRHADLVVA